MPVLCSPCRLVVVTALVGVLAPALRAESLPLHGEPQLLESLRGLGVAVQMGGVCGAPGQLATYNMGANILCMGEGLQESPQERTKVLHHEMVHVVQDCLDGLNTPTSISLS